MDAMRQPVLVVDDEPDVLDMLALVLETAGYLVRKAHNGREALALAEAHPIDLLVTDVKMPVMDGVELLQHFVQVQPGAPVIVMSGYPENALSSGWTFLAKPFLPAALLAAVRAALDEAAANVRTTGRSRWGAPA